MRISISLLALALVACGDDPGEAGDADGSSSDTSSSSTTTTGATLTGSETTSDATESSSGPADGSSDSTGATTDPPPVCDFPSTVDDVFAESKEPPIDCGSLTLNDDLPAWEAARMCARDAALDQAAYKLVWQHDDGSGLRDSAFASLLAETYAVYRFDDDAAVGTTTITVRSCTGIGAPDDCTIAVGEPCMDCLEPSEPSELCD